MKLSIPTLPLLLTFLFAFILISGEELTEKKWCHLNQPRICVELDLVDIDNIKLSVWGPPTNGYLVIGLGPELENSELYMGNYKEDKPQITYYNYQNIKELPKVINSESDITIVSNETLRNKDYMKFTILRKLEPIGLKGAAYLEVDDEPLDLIWGMTDKIDSMPLKLDVFGKIKLKLMSISLVDGIHGNGTKLSSGPGHKNKHSGSSDLDSELEPEVEEEDESEVSILVILHGFFMLIAWGLLPPIGIFMARYMKEKLGVWWFRAHFLIFTSATVLSFIAFTLMWMHNGDVLNSSHGIIGVMVLGLTILQCSLGIVIDQLWDSNRQGIPWHDQLHWWMGRVTSIFGLSNLLIGMLMVPLPYQPLFWSSFILILSFNFGLFVYGATYFPPKHAAHGNGESDEFLSQQATPINNLTELKRVHSQAQLLDSYSTKEESDEVEVKNETKYFNSLTGKMEFR